MIRRQFSFYPENIPLELKRGRRWVCCDAAKVPLIPFQRRRASSTDPETWRDFPEATAALRAYPERYAGVGRVIVAPYIGIDLDDVRHPGTGIMDPSALELLNELASYSEVSPSGEGIKVWVRADLDRSYKKPGCEVYASRRYFTVTGQMLSQYPATVEDRQGEVLELVRREFPSPQRTRPGDWVSYGGPSIELEPYLNLVDVLTEVSDGLGIKYAIRCPWAHEHTSGIGGTYIGKRDQGGCWFACNHAHCSERGWREFADKVRPRAKVIPITRRSGGADKRRTVNIRRV